MTRFSCHRIEKDRHENPEGRVCFVSDLGLVATFVM